MINFIHENRLSWNAFAYYISLINLFLKIKTFMNKIFYLICLFSLKGSVAESQNFNSNTHKKINQIINEDPVFNLKDEVDFYFFLYTSNHVALVLESDESEVEKIKSKVVRDQNEAHLYLIDKMLKLKKSATINPILNEFKSNYENEKERSNSNFFDCFRLIVANKKLEPEVKEDYKRYIDSFQREFRRSGKTYIEQNSYEDAFAKLTELKLRIGDLVDIYMKTVGRYGLYFRPTMNERRLFDKIGETAFSFWVERDPKIILNSYKIQSALINAMLKSTRIFWDNNFWIHEGNDYDGNDLSGNDYERLLFFSKYFSVSNGYNDPAYINHISDYNYLNLSSFLYSVIGNLSKTNVLLALKESGLKEIVGGYLEDKGPSKVSIDYYIREFVVSYMETKEKGSGLEIKVQSDNDCFNSKDVRGFQLPKVKLIYFNAFEDTDWDNEPSTLLIREKLNIFQVDDGLKNNIFIVKKNWSELSEIEKSKYSSAELATLEKEEQDKQAALIQNFKMLQQLDNSLIRNFNGDTSLLHKTLNLVKSIIDEVNTESLKDVSKMFFNVIANSKEGSSTNAAYQDSLSKMILEFYVNNLGNGAFSNENYLKNIQIAPQEGLQFVNILISFILKNKQQYLKSKDNLYMNLVDHYQSIYNLYVKSDAGDEKKQEAYRKFAKSVNENDKLSLTGKCFYDADGVSPGFALLEINSGSNFDLGGKIWVNDNEITANCSGKVVKLPSGDYLFKSNNGDYEMSMQAGLCGVVNLRLKGVGKNSNIIFRFEYLK
jgi:hypothetical protein